MGKAQEDAQRAKEQLDKVKEASKGLVKKVDSELKAAIEKTKQMGHKGDAQASEEAQKHAEKLEAKSKKIGAEAEENVAEARKAVEEVIKKDTDAAKAAEKQEKDVLKKAN